MLLIAINQFTCGTQRYTVNSFSCKSGTLNDVLGSYNETGAINPELQNVALSVKLPAETMLFR